MDPNHTLIAGITVTKLNGLHSSLEHAEALNNTLLSIISIYANEENYTQKGLNHTLALDFLEKLKEQNIIQKFEIKPTDDKPSIKSTSKFKPRLV
jgi:hypothetical protein